MNALQNTQIDSMPPPLAAWSFLRARRHLGWALAASLGIHLAIYIFSPQFVATWLERAEPQYAAILVPSDFAPPLAGAGANVKPAQAKNRPPRKTRADRKPPPVVAPVADASLPAADDANNSDVGNESVSDAAKPVNVAAETPKEVPVVPAEEKAPAPEPVIETSVPPDLPSRIAISYKATSSLSDGVADYTWKRDGSKYVVDSSLQASGFVVALLAGVMHQVSRGEVTAGGLQPESFMLRRGDAEPETAEFLRASNEMKLTRSGKSRLLPLPAKIQDTQSFLFQLAFDAPRLKTAEDRLEVLVTNARKVYRHQFKQLGQATIQTKFGPVTTLHLLSEAADPEDAYEVWLSPEHFHLPVKLRFYAGRFPIELIATSIRSTP